MEEWRIVLCGVGGQGILFATNILSQAALAHNLPVIGSETHGMAQRGGSVVSHLKIGSAKSPLVRRGTCDFLFILEERETGRYLDFPRPGSLCFVNAGSAPSVREDLLHAFKRREVAVYAVAADKMALAMGAPLSANLILLGFASPKLPSPFSYENLEKIVCKLSPERFLAQNHKALNAGRDCAKK